MTAPKPRIELEHGEPDRLVPKDFKDILINRFVPILSLTCVMTILGVAVQHQSIHGDVFHALFRDKSAYIISFFVGAWVSIPAVLWVLLKGSIEYSHAADDWYKILASLITFTLLISFVLFPELNILGLRTYLAASVPVFGLIYLFFVKGSFPPRLAYPLNVIGIIALMMGVAVCVVH